MIKKKKDFVSRVISKLSDILCLEMSFLITAVYNKLYKAGLSHAGTECTSTTLASEKGTQCHLNFIPITE